MLAASSAPSRELASPRRLHTGLATGPFAVNLVGALLLGYFVARLGDHPEDSLAHPFLTIGVCGTLTTFSTLQLELFEMVDAGHIVLAAGYIGVTLIAGFLFVRLGISLERRPEPVR